MSGNMFRLCAAIVTGLTILISADCYAQTPDNNTAEEESRPLTRKEQKSERKRLKNMPLDIPELRQEGFRVSAGQRSGIKIDSLQGHIADSLAIEHDSLALAAHRADSIATGSTAEEIIRSSRPMPSDSTLLLTQTMHGDTTLRISGEITAIDTATISQRDIRKMRKAELRADTTLYRHSPLFRDSIPISRMALISVVAPGFSQLYNGDYWKIPVLYAVTGTSLYFGIRQHNKFKPLKKEYEALMTANRFDREKIDPVQNRMIKHNTWRQLFFAGALGTYIYFIGDGVVNYPAMNTQVKVATTLSTIFPGAGQFYNKSYWRVPIVVGAFASMVYVIDWNNRGYQRFQKAYDDFEIGNEFGNSVSKAELKSYKDAYRRSRDLAIILTAALYVVNIIDAHVDAHLKDYDVSDDLGWNFRVEPTMNTSYTQTFGVTNSFGLNLCFTF